MHTRRLFQRAQVMLELASGLSPSLDQEAISLLYRATKPLVLDDAFPQLQKRAYKVRHRFWTAQLSILLKLEAEVSSVAIIFMNGIAEHSEWPRSLFHGAHRPKTEALHVYRVETNRPSPSPGKTVRLCWHCALTGPTSCRLRRTFHMSWNSSPRPCSPATCQRG